MEREYRAPRSRVCSFIDKHLPQSIFTLGLCLSSVLDVLIAFSLCFFLQISRTGFGR